MNDKIRSQKTFKTRPPRLKDLVNKHVMGDVWIRDTPFGPVTDSLVISKKFDIRHDKILRSIKKLKTELATEPKFGFCRHLIENTYVSGPKGREKKYRKVDITEFGLALLLLYINSPKARKISAEIIYHFFVLKNYLSGLRPRQIGSLRGYYRDNRLNLKQQKEFNGNLRKE